MSQSIKSKNNTYIDSTSVVHNKELLSEILNNKFLNYVGSINDNETKKFTIQQNRVYLFFNTHTFYRSVLLITTYSGGLNSDVIFKSSDSAVPTVTMSGTTLTIKTTNQARGYLYQIVKAYSA